MNAFANAFVLFLLVLLCLCARAGAQDQTTARGIAGSVTVSGSTSTLTAPQLNDLRQSCRMADPTVFSILHEGNNAPIRIELVGFEGALRTRADSFARSLSVCCFVCVDNCHWIDS